MNDAMAMLVSCPRCSSFWSSPRRRPAAARAKGLLSPPWYDVGLFMLGCPLGATFLATALQARKRMQDRCMRTVAGLFLRPSTPSQSPFARRVAHGAGDVHDMRAIAADGDVGRAFVVELVFAVAV